MLIMEETSMTTNEVKEYLNISNFIFNTLVRQGQLQPINKSTWRLDGSFLFKREDVQKLKEERQIEGVTLYQASKKFQVSMYQLENWLKNGDLPYTVQEHRNRTSKFIKEDDVCELIQKMEQDHSVYTFSQKHRVILFQKFIKGNTVARIISIPKRGHTMLVDEFGNYMKLDDAIKEGFEPAHVLSDKPRSHHQRFVKFRFPKSNQLRSEIFQIIDLILQYVSPRNIKVSEEDFWYFNIRQSLISLPSGLQAEWIEALTPYIIEGKIIPRVNHSVYLDSNTVTKPITFSNNEYQSIIQIAKETNSSIEEFVKSAIMEKSSQYFFRKN